MFIHSKGNSLYLLTQIPSPSHSLPLGNHKSVLQVHEFLFCGKVHFCTHPWRRWGSLPWLRHGSPRQEQEGRLHYWGLLSQCGHVQVFWGRSFQQESRGVEGSSYLTVQEMMTWGKGAQFCPLLAEGDFTSLPMLGSRLPGRGTQADGASSLINQCVYISGGAPCGSHPII